MKSKGQKEMANQQTSDNYSGKTPQLRAVF
jgi:hypothetical protein